MKTKLLILAGTILLTSPMWFAVAWKAWNWLCVVSLEIGQEIS